MNKIRTLIVDDHVMMRDGIRALLDLQDDIEVVGEASEGTEAVAKVEELKPDVVVMDIAMPGMNGIEATQQIKAKNPNIKVLILTQHDKREYILSAIKAGGSGYVSKKALGSELINAIRTVYQGQSFLYPSAATTLIEELRRGVAGKDPFDQLTPREKEVLKLIAEGRTSREIADKLFISLKTVLAHRAKIMQKLKLHNRSLLIKYAMSKGMVDFDV
jgi:DNA-binding NarL/FixJ family response regulator